MRTVPRTLFMPATLAGVLLVTLVPTWLGAQGPVSAIETRVDAPDVEQSDLYGYAVDVQGDVLAVGNRNDSDDGSDSGSVSVFVRDGASWTFAQKLTASDAAAGDSFGYAVAVLEDWIVVGAPGDDDMGTSSGSVYVFLRAGGVWVEYQKLVDATGGASSAYFGRAVAIDASDPHDVPGSDIWYTIVVGIPEYYYSAPYVGCVLLFKLGLLGWEEDQRLLAPDPQWGDVFGTSVAISWDFIAIGAPDAACAAGNNCGKAFMAARGSILGTWSCCDVFEASDGEFGDEYGLSVDLTWAGGSSFMVVGAPGWDGAESNDGRAYLYHYWGQWNEQVIDPAVATDNFGWSVSVNPDFVAVGVPASEPTGVANSGAAYMYRYNRDGVLQYPTIVASDAVAADNLGQQVSLGPRPGELTLVAGAPGKDDIVWNGGTAYAFDLIFEIFSDGFESGDTSAWSIAVP